MLRNQSTALLILFIFLCSASAFSQTSGSVQAVAPAQTTAAETTVAGVGTTSPLSKEERIQQHQERIRKILLQKKIARSGVTTATLATEQNIKRGEGQTSSTALTRPTATLPNPAMSAADVTTDAAKEARIQQHQERIRQIIKDSQTRRQQQQKGTK